MDQSIYPFWIVATWIGLFSIVVRARIFDRRRYQREPHPAETAMGWGRRFALGAAAALVMNGHRANRWIASSARRGIILATLTADLEKQVADRKLAETELHRSNGF
jgi:hypothetical protein